jgi:hypothetical protein
LSSDKPASPKKNPPGTKNLLICAPLKRLAAILLLGILFFDWYGYQLLSLYWQHQAENKLVARLDGRDYQESDLVSIKIPLTTLSYYNSSPGFERVDGAIDIGGVRYNYVKRRIFKDSLELLCIPNMTAISLQKAKNEFFGQVNDLQQNNQGKKNTNTTTKDFSKDYRPTAMDIAVPGAPALLVTKAWPITDAPGLPSRSTPTPEMPPDQA